MPRDGAGNFTLAPGNPVVPGTVIEAAWANPTLSDIANNLTDSLSRTGQGGMLVPFRNTDGLVGSPGMSWANEPSSGWYRAGLNDFWYSVGNENIFRITKTGVELAAGKTFVNGAYSSISVTSGILVASNPGISLTQTWNNAAVQFVGKDTNITDTASDVASLLERWRVGGVEKATIRKDGAVVVTSLQAAGSAARGIDAWGGTVDASVKIGDCAYLGSPTAAVAGQLYATSNLFYDGAAWRTKRAGGGAMVVVNSDQQLVSFSTTPIVAAGAAVAPVEQVRVIHVGSANRVLTLSGGVSGTNNPTISTTAGDLALTSNTGTVTLSTNLKGGATGVQFNITHNATNSAILIGDSTAASPFMRFFGSTSAAPTTIDGRAQIWDFRDLAAGSLLKIDGNKRLLLNGISPSSNTPGLYLNGLATNQAGTIEMKDSGNGTITQMTFGLSNGPAGVGDDVWWKFNTGCRIICFNVSGGVALTQGATAWAAVSDERFKTIIEPITNALPKISALRTVMGRYTDDDPVDKRRPFLIAQDVLKVLPEAVDASRPEKLYLTYTDLLPLLVAAVKEVSAILEANNIH